MAETTLRKSWFWPTSAQFPGPWGIFSSPGDSKQTHDGLGFQWNSERKAFWTLTFELLDRNIGLLYFKTERVAETALRESVFWPTSSRFRGTWGIFSSSGDWNLLFEGLALQWNGHSITFWTLTFELLGRNIAPRVAETALGTSRS